MDDALLLRFLTHTCTPADTRRISNWLAAGKAHAEWLFEMERIWSLKKEFYYSDEKEIEKAYLRFRNGLASSQKKRACVPDTGNKAKRRLRIFRLLYGYAVALVLLISIGLSAYHAFKPAAPSFRTVEVPRGQRSSILLPDGSRVWLNSESRFTYPSEFSKECRQVRLTGEAFFEVASNKEWPFIIQSPQLSVKVLGTQFNMQAYPGESQVITLAEGMIEVATHSQGKKTELKPNEQITYTRETGMRLMRQVETGLVKSWTKGEIVFVDKTLEEIVPVLERRYDISIQLSDTALAKEVFTCHFKESASIRQILGLLQATGKTDYAFAGNRIQLFKPVK